MTTWTDDLKALVIKEYTAQNPTPETSANILAVVAHDNNVTVNGLRSILAKAQVYVSNTKAASASKPKAEGSGTRVSKEDSHAALAAAITAKGGSVDMDIISKLTGKAAVYFTQVLS